MKTIDELEKIAVLIDADNAQLQKLKLILDEVSTHGRIVLKKAYGNWRSSILKNWQDELNLLAIKPEQQFAYTTGKNATDISMAIDAMDLLNTNIYDAFVLVSSDSDFTPLAIRLRESGVYVLGVGEQKTPHSFRNACDDFILTEYLSNDKPKALSDDKQQENADKEQIINEKTELEEVHSLLRKAHEKYQDTDGWVNVSSAGTFIKRAKPDFNPKAYDFFNLPDLLMGFPQKYEMKKYKGKGTVNIIAYKCI